MSATDMVTVIESEKVAYLNDLHRRCEEHKAGALGAALEAGTVLLAVKAALRHGELGPWLAANFEGSERTARTYMQLACAPEQDRQRVAGLPIRQARDQLARPRRMSAGEMGSVFAGAPGAELPPRQGAVAFSAQQERKQHRVSELLGQAALAVEQARRDGLAPAAIARSYRDGARAAQRAAVTFDELAQSFER